MLIFRHGIFNIFRPKMSSPCRAEQVALWLNAEEEEEEKEDLKTLQQVK